MCNQCMLYSLTVPLHHMHIRYTLHSLYLKISAQGAVDAFKYTGEHVNCGLETKLNDMVH